MALSRFSVGDIVRHPDYGMGPVTSVRLGLVTARFERGSQRFTEAHPRVQLIRTAAEQQHRDRLATEQDCERARRQAEVDDRVRRRQALAEHLKFLVENNYLGVDAQWAGHPDGALINRHEVDQMRKDFVRSWVERELGETLDDEQAAAVAATSGDVKVVARAGSGKTRTLVARAAFLQRHCGVAPGEQLLLAFNRRAATEVRARLASHLGAALPHIMTFHALAHALLHPDEDLLFDEPKSGSESLSREIQDVIDEHIRSPKYRDQIREVMLAHFRDDWERIVEGQIELPIKEFLKYRRSLVRETLAGTTVKSFGERLIANTLFENDVPYAYERNHRWRGTNYRPDFTLLVPTGIVIEYFGLEGDPDYDAMSASKRDYWHGRDGWTLLEYAPGDISRAGVAAFQAKLLADLRALGVATRPRSEQEIWQEVRQRAIDHFTRTVRTFIARCRKRDFSVEDLETLALKHEFVSNGERTFVGVATSVYAGYLDRLSQKRKDDFDGLLWRAGRAVHAGQTRFARDRFREHGDLSRIRFVQVDEFQDFSAQFYELLIGIRRANPAVRFYCVGDDWQAINGFAGADLRYFREFDRLFLDPTQREITTNYRSTAPVVFAGNALMHGLGVPASPKERRDDGAHGPSVAIALLDEFQPSPREQDIHQGDDLTPAVLRLTRRSLDAGQGVVLLSRRNGVRGYVNLPRHQRRSSVTLEVFADHVRSFLPEGDRERVTVSTTHGFKGLESDAVVILDAFQGSYPLIHPGWIFNRILGDSLDEIDASERRLFYVALTRARRSLSIVSESRRPSPYIRDIQRRSPLANVAWKSLAAVNGDGGARLEVRVVCPFALNDRLKDLRYRWSPEGKYWAKSVPAEGFDSDLLLGQEWVQDGVRIVVVDDVGRRVLEHG